MRYSDSLYLAKFAVDPDSEFVGLDINEEFNYFDSALINKLDDEIAPEIDDDMDIE